MNSTLFLIMCPLKYYAKLGYTVYGIHQFRTYYITETYSNGMVSFSLFWKSPTLMHENQNVHWPKSALAPGFQTWPYPTEKSFSERYKQGSREFEVGSWLTPLPLALLHDYWLPQSLQSRCRRLYCGRYTIFALRKFQRLSLAPLDGD